MSTNVDYSKLTREELVALLSKKTSKAGAFGVGELVGLECTLLVNEVPLPVKLGSIMVDKRSAAVMFTVTDTLFGVYKVRKDIASLLSELELDRKSDTYKLLFDAVANRNTVRSAMKEFSKSFDEAYRILEESVTNEPVVEESVTNEPVVVATIKKKGGKK